MNAFVSRNAIECATLTRTTPTSSPRPGPTDGRPRPRHWFARRPRDAEYALLNDF
jgi:hypothetical protein